MITKDMGNDVLCFHKDRKEYWVKVSDIVCIERNKRTINVRLKNDNIVEINYTSLSKILQEAQNNRLQRCGRSVIVNWDYVCAVDPLNHYVILKENKGRVELGSFYKESVLAVLAKNDNEILLRIDNIRYVIRVEEVLYAKSSNRVLRIVLYDGREFCVSQKPIEYILKQVKTDKLIRCARGVLVNREYINKIDYSEMKLMLINGLRLDIGRKYVGWWLKNSIKITK